MHHICLATTLVGSAKNQLSQSNAEAFKPPPIGRNKKNDTEPGYRSFWLPRNKVDMLENLRNEILDDDLSVLLEVATSASNVSDKHLDTVKSWEISADRCIVRFSARFHAMWFRRNESTIWFCVVDGEFVVFALTPGKSTLPILSIHDKEIPQIAVPQNGLKWTELQEQLVNRFENDDHVRAISAAIMLSCNPHGEFEGVANTILPALLRQPEWNLKYDSPMDEDMMTVLADAKTSGEKDLIFDCGGGHSAVSTLNESMGRLKRIPKKRNLLKFVESSAMLMPFVFA